MNLPLGSCPECGGDLADQPAQSEEKRQVFDLPDIRMLVTEYLAERKRCPHCGALASAEFPCGVTAPVQYGPGMQSAMMLSFNRNNNPPDNRNTNGFRCAWVVGRKVLRPVWNRQRPI